MLQKAQSESESGDDGPTLISLGATADGDGDQGLTGGQTSNLPKYSVIQ